MCTVTFIPAGEKIFLVSNRDEKHWRSPAVSPQPYDFPSGKIYFPKDADAGGTWFAVHENGNAIVLLNGGFKAHVPQPPYRMSRGLVTVELIQVNHPFDRFRSINLENIEPFTLVLWENEELFECRWDGERKHSKQLDKTAPQIWSSVTLYSEEVIMKRQTWFEDWLKSRSIISLDDVLNFHRFTGDGDDHNDLLINRNGKVFTVSITGVGLSATAAHIKYLDLLTNQLFLQDIALLKEPATHL